MGYRVRFTVRGSGQFPLDMLRYDHCWPATQEDVSWMKMDGERELMLETEIPHLSLIKSERYPHKDRWSSFGWDVTEVYKPTRK